ncbi:uncharacterized protein LOC105203007 [Solenopsis invicta]|uniref:uncharacterized protein LOC105203007 n=1 Tax=Solenopsis invicta TaxID=13686 RepID=UPI000596005A|nr:uncharacterized protein LOC105203007 [Solenopsis invicta]
MECSGVKITLWSDSTIALQWILSESRRWAAFVANRVGEIQRATENAEWRHVPSAENPADVLSRGADLAALAVSSTWWNGPSFLQLNEGQWPTREIELSDELPERKRVITAVAAEGRSVVSMLLEKHSSLEKIQRIIAYCLRTARSRRTETRELCISHWKMTAAMRALIRSVQRESFPREYRRLSEGRPIDGGRRILSLTPFIDEHGVIRVGGRIGRAALPPDALHPMLLPKSHTLTILNFRKEHIRNLHAGLQATTCAVRQRYWSLAARSTVHKVIHKCVACVRCKPVASQAIMAELPGPRVTVSRPFTHTGLDYAGPILIKESKRRNAKMLKAYIAVFICFATKAVHLEIVSDFTSEAFLGAFKRFMSRRGRPARVYSDNGTTFVGANRQIKEMYELVNGDQAAIRQFAQRNEFEWNFIPPHAPHFGGLWEAAVKSAKFHMYRVVGNANLTFEEMETVLCEIEAVLNSRPLTPLSEDANDLTCLTPGHCLVGAALNSFPVTDLTAENPGRLLRWQRVEQMRQHFWRRWSTEYIHTLIERRKWRANQGEQLKIGQLVLIQQPRLGPLQWLLGRVAQIHPGADGIVRTATLRTGQGQLTRPLTRLAVLPIGDAD